MRTATSLVTNLHCPSCVSLIQDVLGNQPNSIIGSVDVSLLRQTVSCIFDETVTDVSSIISTLIRAAFEVQHVTLTDNHGRQITNYGPDFLAKSKQQGRSTSPLRRAQQKHIENCDACKSEKIGAPATHMNEERLVQRTKASIATSSLEVATDQPRVVPPAISHQLDTTIDFVVTIAIQGMTCSSCVGSINRGLEELQYVKKFNIDLVTVSEGTQAHKQHSATTPSHTNPG